MTDGPLGGGKEPGVGGEGPAGLGPGSLLSLGGPPWGSGSESGLVSGQKSGVPGVSNEAAAAGGVEGVDEGVEAFASGAVGHVGSVEDSGDLGGELGTVLVVGKVPVGGVVGVDEGVEVGVDGLVIVLHVVWDQGLGLDRLGGGPPGGGASLDNWAGSLLDWGLNGGWGWGGSGDVGGGILT